MFNFTYSAVNCSGQKLFGQLNAASRGEALQSLAQQTLLPLTLVESRVTPLRRRRVKPAAIAAACSLLADQLDTGVPLLKALRVMEQQTSSSGLRTVLAAVADRVADGATLADAMTEHGEVFGELDVSMVRAGEEGGFLDESLKRLATVRERQEEIRGRLLSALAYPTLLMAAGAIVVTGMLTFFVPKFEPLFESLRQSDRLPLPTAILLTVSSFLQYWGLPLLVICCLALIAVRSLVPFQTRQLFYDRQCLRLKGVGPVLQSLAIARFCRVLGTLLQNGVPMLKSLEIARSATGNRVLSEAVRAAADSICSGRSLSVPLAASGHFPPDVLEMLSVAEQSNRLSSVLLKLADKLESRSQLRIDLLIKLLEPLLMLIMAIIVGFLVIALLMPVFEGNGMT